MVRDTLYVSRNCPASQRVMSMIAHAPTVVRKNVEVNEITQFSNTPPSVTAVPTLIQQDGKMLVGDQVFRYLRKMRQDPDFPETPEMSERENFLGLDLGLQGIDPLYIIAAALLVLFLILMYRGWTPAQVLTFWR